MTLYRRRLPHTYLSDRPVFLTWRLHGSIPQNRHFDGGTVTSGQAFATLDRLLDEARTGPRYLSLPTIADLVVKAIHFNAEILGHYVLHAFAVMPNHVHALLSPRVPIPKLTKSLKGITARRANAILGQTGSPFWQEESFDREVRQGEDFERILLYIENNPVRAGLASEANQYRWSSASPRLDRKT